MCRFDCVGTRRPMCKVISRFTILSMRSRFLVCVFVACSRTILTLSSARVQIWFQSPLYSLHIPWSRLEPPKLNWYKRLDQNQVRLFIKDKVEKCSELPSGITLHSMRCGGSFYRVFESPDRRLNFRELMAWCRWEDAKTCCEYLITRSITNDIDPKNLLRVNGATAIQDGCPVDMEKLCNEIVKRLQKVLSSPPACAAAAVVGPSHSLPVTTRALPAPIRAHPDSARSFPVAVSRSQRQMTLDGYVTHAVVPTARSAKEAWIQRFTGDPQVGLFQPLRSFNKHMIRADRRKFSERLTLSLAFRKYVSYEMF
ncbi:hypothetical protein AC1031_018591 [Aphanomyces cochlioides]|nr:hypothetical protein AC1031_018591 [Aphanomyces cochlioides]